MGQGIAEVAVCNHLEHEIIAQQLLMAVDAVVRDASAQMLTNKREGFAGQDAGARIQCSLDVFR